MRRKSTPMMGFISCLILLMGLFAVQSWAQDTAAPPANSPETLTLDDTTSDVAPRPDYQEKTVLDTLMDGGTVGVLIGLLSMVAIGFIVEHFLTIRKSVLMPEGVAFELEEMIAQGRVDEALEMCKNPEYSSLLTYVVEAGLERFRGAEFGFAEYKAAVEEAGEDQTARLYRKTEVLGLIGSIAPMLGLTGTVLGMIRAFNTIAATGGTPKPEDLAGSIGQALVTTLLGLVVAIPAMVAYSYFGNRIDSLVAEVGKRVEQILTPLGRRR
ncbi:MotA/TolQ/ExbB proton channel family protein [Blastopirellula marina]|uniref:MotA/TolQ/ExbB proton channel family protein n=1 Tax=Blastopirellula marina TaxID=124 RepID=A0A2S8FWY4_9BACT|nr:MotA/TolQ/ExbB proton channel family protein [Blastopirellula marina]PQO36685.1 MotA/TolQ/ExbB proton channel family protein [Blastopirellula marina]PTL44515.1 MotA/TolQ/ExbB proton channel family protein [Blastopirellula marina]